MLQRSQTVYLLLALVSLLSALLMPAFQLVGSDYLLELFPYGAQGELPAAIAESVVEMSPVAMGALLSFLVGVGLEIAALFLFKNRHLPYQRPTLVPCE
jgi:hypothetical protein